MKRLKKILLALLGLLAILALFIFIFLNSLTPTYEGKQELKGLDEGVEVYFDAYGVPIFMPTTKPMPFALWVMCMPKIDYGKWNFSVEPGQEGYPRYSGI